MIPGIEYPRSNSRRRISAYAGIKLLPAIFIFLLCFAETATGQNEPEYDEIAVYMEVKDVGATEMPSVINNKELFLPVTDLFDFLRIRNVSSAGLDSISGFFIDPDARFYISRTNNSIIYREKLFQLQQGDLIRTETNLYLRSDYFGKIFGLECIFNFRSLSVIVRSQLELPYIKELKQEELRRNLTRLKGENIADRTIGRTYPGFRFGMADWSVIASEEINGTSEARMNLALGAMVAGGETNIQLYYNTQQKFSEKQQNYLWRYVNNDFSALRQISAGKIQTQAVSSIYNPVVGVQLTNTPSSYRRSFGSYTLSDRTEPGWIVELYVNNVLVDYVKADASGFFTFQVPLVYGNTIVKLKFYGPWGEERTKEQNVNIPYNFLPPKTLEYTVSAGMVEDTLFSRFSRGSINYGLTRNLTVGAGAEYLSSVSSGPLLPFVKASFRAANNILLYGEYTYGVRAKGNLSYRMPSNIQFDIDYIWYHKGQKAINYNYLEERKVSASAPLKLGNFASYNRLSFNQFILPLSHYAMGEWLFSGSLGAVSSNITTFGVFMEEVKPYFYSNISVSARLPAKFVLTPQAQYGISDNKLLSAKLKVEKYLGTNAFMNLSFERHFTYGTNMTELGIRYDFSFARTGASIRQLGRKTSFIEQANGSLITDTRTRFITPENRNNVGRGGITIIPFFDINANGKMDQGEERVPGLNARANGGKVIISEKDTIIRITGLEPYTSCFIELDASGFENISWQLPYRTLSVVTDPNILKTIEVPVNVVGEAGGTVTLEEKGNRTGQGRIIINFYTEKLEPVGRLLTEDDGYFSLFGLKPGNYLVRIDTSQLRKLRMKSEPDSIPFTIRGGAEGDLIEGLDFNLKKTAFVPAEEEIVIPEPVVRKDTSYMVVHEVSEELVTISKDSWAIQLGAFRKRSNAEAMKKKLERVLGRKVEIVVADDFYKVRISEIGTREEVDDVVKKLGKNGISELWIISLKAKQQQRVLIEKSDSVAVVRDIVDSSALKPVPPPVLSVQVGAFRSGNYAQALKKKLSAIVSNPVEIVYEDSYYKVRITGFANREDLERMLPSLGMMGLRDIWVPAVKIPQPAVKPVTVPADTVRPAVTAPADTTGRKEEVKPQVIPAEKPAFEEPPVSMLVGEFLKKRDAVRAQRKVFKKLGLESEIREQWGYYYLRIGGFYTREETYKYYPELAGIGLRKINVIDLR